MTSISQRPAIEGVLVGAASTAVKSPALNVAIGVSAVVMVVGLVLWFMQLSGGMVQTAMRNLDSWGLYITGFMFFVGLSAGGLIISSVPKALGIRGFGGISKVAVFSSIACTVVAIGLVVVDMGQPGPRVGAVRVLQLLRSPPDVGHPGPRHLPHPVGNLPVGPD